MGGVMDELTKTGLRNAERRRLTIGNNGELCVERRARAFASKGERVMRRNRGDTVSTESRRGNEILPVNFSYQYLLFSLNKSQFFYF